MSHERMHRTSVTRHLRLPPLTWKKRKTNALSPPVVSMSDSSPRQAAWPYGIGGP